MWVAAVCGWRGGGWLRMWEDGLDPEVAATLENSEGLEFDSAEKLEDDSGVLQIF